MLLLDQKAVFLSLISHTIILQVLEVLWTTTLNSQPHHNIPSGSCVDRLAAYDAHSQIQAESVRVEELSRGGPANRRPSLAQIRFSSPLRKLRRLIELLPATQAQTRVQAG